jgi:hypothetical protein
MTTQYVVVNHHQYAPDSYRVYSSQDEYLEEYPSMYTLVYEGLTEEEAEWLCDELNQVNLDAYYLRNQ